MQPDQLEGGYVGQVAVGVGQNPGLGELAPVLHQTGS
jgi:hypothetical protein